MPVQRSGSGGSSSVSYADHDVHWVRHRIQFEDTADAGPDINYQSEEQYEITARGLDPDELAELRAVQFSAMAYGGPDPSIDQNEDGAIRANIGAGYNLTGTEFVAALSPTGINDAVVPDGLTEDIDIQADGDDFVKVTKDTDEVGQILNTQVQYNLGFREAGDGVGGGGSGTVVNGLVNMADLFGSGPFVDAADDFTSAIALEVDNVVGTAGVEVVYGLYYDVNEVEGGRTRFGR